MTGQPTKQLIIDTELARLYQQRNELTADIVLAAAKKPSSPLHAAFEWDDKVAGHKWRLDQAWRLIQGSQYMLVLSAQQQAVTPTAGPLASSDLRGFIHAGDAFFSRDDVLADKKKRAQFLEGKNRELRGWCQSVSDVTEFDQIRRYILSKLP